MRLRKLGITGWLFVAAPAALAFTQFMSPLRVQPASRLWVTGTSTVRGFECKAKSFDAVVDATVPNAIAAVLAGEKAVGSVELKVPVEQLDCDNDTMNGHMLKAIKGKEFKEIVFSLSSYDLAKATDGSLVTIKGSLSLGGVRKDITLDASAKPGPDGALVVTGKYGLRMTEYGLKPPSLMLGTMKVNELVNVNFELLLKP